MPTKIKWFKPNMFHPWCQTRDNSFGRISPKIAVKICVAYHKWRGHYFTLKWNCGPIIPHFHHSPSILSPFQWKHTMTRYLVPGIYNDFANTANHSICHWRVYSSGEKVIHQHYWHIDTNEYMNSRCLQTKTQYLIMAMYSGKCRRYELRYLLPKFENCFRGSQFV